MDEKNLEALEVIDEQLDGVAGGRRASADLETPVPDIDEEGEDAGISPIIRCPKCGRSIRFCICPR